MRLLVTPEQGEALLANGRRTAAGEDFDPVPIVRLFAPDGPQQWLLTEVAEDGVSAYGLCDLGIGQPECGEVDLEWLASLTGPAGMPVERDQAFPRAGTPSLEYMARAASAAGRIVI